ncbi:hypothetical protein KJ562_01135 [Patescibacteria group bacterium]|nr:hypothetical protein [Patescibacteria group bacterium]MBU4162098.1 hypothetical protein [Patescibacteria group bacterium]
MDEQEQNYNVGGTINQSSESLQIPVKKPKKNIVFGVAVGIVVIIIGMGIVFASGIWDPVWNPLRPSPNKIIMEALDNMSGLNSMRTMAIISIKPADSAEGKTEITIDAKEDKIDPNNPKSQALFDISFVKGGIEVGFNAELRSIDNVFYMNVTIPLVLTLQLATSGIDISEFVGKWYKFDPKELGINLAILNDEAESGKIKDQVMNLLNEYPLFKTKSKLRNEKIDGNLAYHYLVAIDRENAKNFLVSVSKTIKEELGSLLPVETSDEENIKEIEDALEKAGDIEFEIWIGVKDKYVYKIEANESFYALNKDSGQTEKTALGFEMIFSEFNQPQEILAPDSPNNIIDLLMPFFQMFMMGGVTGIPL